MIKTKQVYNLISFLGLGIGLLLIIIAIFWGLYPYKPMTINKRPLPVINKEVKRGQVLTYTLDYCKNMNLPVVIYRRFIDGLVFSVPDVTANTEIGCRVLNVGIEIPKELPVGEYVLTIAYKYEVNPIRTVEVSTHTEKFKVVN